MILIPVKNSEQAKQRLAPIMSQPERTELARAMVEDVLEALASSASRELVAVVTSDDFARSVAARHSMKVIDDPENAGESEAIAMATHHCLASGANFTMVMPADIPLLTGAEVDDVIASAPEQGTVLVPAADGRGTNAVLRKPGDLFPLKFGNDSFKPHLAAAQSTGLPVEIRELPGIALDVDRPDDITDLLRIPVRTRTQRLLLKWNIFMRFTSAAQSAGGNA